MFVSLRGKLKQRFSFVTALASIRTLQSWEKVEAAIQALRRRWIVHDSLSVEKKARQRQRERQRKRKRERVR